MSNSTHSWRFFRAGGFDQVRLDRGSDLAHLAELEQTLWVALACPTRGIEFDTVTLDLIDTDKDGRIRAPEIIAATQWAISLLKSPDELVNPAPALALDAINSDSVEGKQVLASARQILINLGKASATSISVEDTTDTAKIFAATNFNGDGIIPADASEDPAVKAVIADIIACLGAETDRSTKPGINQAKADQFFKEAQAYADWLTAADPAVLPLGEATAGAFAALNVVRPKIDDFFARCRLAAFDARALAALNREEKEYLALAAKDLTITSQEIAAFPLARVAAGAALPLGVGVNPAWAAAIEAFRVQVVVPLLGERETLSEGDYVAIVGKLTPFTAHLASKPVTAGEKLGAARLREILAGPAKAAINELIARDKALEPEALAIASVDKLIRCKRDLHKLLNNFVNFRDFYTRKDKAVFQVGRLYLDQRACDLAVRVDDAGKHGLMAHLSQCYLAYCDVTRKSTGEKMAIAAAFTAGDSDNLMVGRNGLFYDRHGHDWDATITKIVENPISIRQAFWAPYKRVVRWIADYIAKRAAAADAASTTRVQGAATTLDTAVTSPGKPLPPPPPPPAAKLDVGVVAVLGLAFASISSALAFLLNWLAGIPLYVMPLYIVVVMLLISTPSMILAWLKLRQRNLGPILDANGWAVNARAKINIPFGRSLTRTRVLPSGSQRDLFDPYAESHRGRWIAIIVALVVITLGCMWYFGCIEHYVPNVLPKSGHVLHKEAAKAAADKKAEEEKVLVEKAKAATQPATQAVPATQGTK